MMKKIGYVLMSLMACMQAEAVLPPLYETASEIRAMLSDSQLGQKLHSGEAIDKIEKTDQGYEISTNKSRISVEVIYEPQNRPGPAHYKFQFGEPSRL
jgi:hypothetical protein